VFNHAHVVRNSFIQGAALLAILIFPLESQAQTTDCATELGTSSGYTSLINGGSASQQKKVDEWDGEVIKIRTSLPGVLVLEGTGPGLESSLYTDASSGPYPMLDSAQLGTSLPELQTIIPAGDHCIQVTPGVGEDDFEVEATFIDVCHLGDVDDHGDSLLCATPVTVGGSSVSGEITSSLSINDIDRFTFVLGSAATVTIESTGSTDVEADLYNEAGSLLISDDDSGASDNFQITQSLAAGRYYVRVKGSNGSYGIGVVTVP
jgi:Bacterial pre-peptidase C-terminal domain